MFTGFNWFFSNREKACWLGSWYIWAFKGFITIVIAGNVVALSVGLKTAFKVTKRKNLSNWEKTRSWFRNFFILSFLLGITWILGYFNNLGVEAQYVFVLLNASSGKAMKLIWMTFRGHVNISEVIFLHRHFHSGIWSFIQPFKKTFFAQFLQYIRVPL